MARRKLDEPTIGDLLTYRTETVWRVTEDDIRTAIADKYPGVSQAGIDMIIDRAHLAFSIHDWAEQVIAFADTVLEDE